MSILLTEPYASIYEEYLVFQKNRVSNQGYISLKNRTRIILQWFGNEQISLENVTIIDAVKFKEHLCCRVKKDGNVISTGTMINYLKAAKKLFQFLLYTERLKSNPFDEVAYPRLPVHISRNLLSESQMNLLLNKLKRFNELSDLCNSRNRYCCHVLAEFLYATGLRANEAASVKLTDLNLEQKTVFVQNGKGGNQRIAYLTDYAADVLNVFIAKTRCELFYKTHVTRTDLLFGLTDHSLEKKLNKELKSVCTELEIPVITCHGFRHSLGTHLLRAGCDMRHIQIILGHESIESTKVYTYVYKEDLRKCLDTYHPRQSNEGKK